MRKYIVMITALLTVLCLVFPMLPASAAASPTSGWCGNEARWSLNRSTGVLTIEGKGYTTGSPWLDYSDLVPAIRKVVVCEGITGLGSRFEDCKNLSEASLPESLQSISAGVFSGCEKIASIKIPSQVTILHESVFSNCTSLAQITLPKNIEYILDDAFYSCISLKSISFSNNLEEIGDRAFACCESLTDVTIPAGTKKIGECAFVGCKRLKFFQVSAANTAFSSQNGVLYNKAKTQLIQAPGAIGGSYAIPNSVKTICRCSFSGCEGLTGVTIPDGVTNIGIGAFEDCIALKSVILPDSVVSLGAAAFSGCKALKKVVIGNGVKRIDMRAFGECTALSDLTIGNSVDCISNEAFYGCTSLSFVRIPDSTKTMEGWAFFHCPNLTGAWIPDSVTFMEDASIGYRFKPTGDGTAKNEDFVIYGVKGSVAETYANENGFPFNAIQRASIVTQPESATAAFGENAVFTVVASGTDLSFQWQYQYAGTTDWRTWVGKTEPALTVTGSATNNNCQYRCVVSNLAGSVTSAAATLKVSPKITTQPKSITIGLGAKTAFTVAARGEDLKYQWQYKYPSGDWINWSGKTEPSLIVTGKESDNGCQYRCVVTNPAGSATSEAAVLTVVEHDCPCAEFIDMPSVGTEAHAAIDWAYSHIPQITNGTSASAFSPAAGLTRAQAVTFLWRAAGEPEPAGTENPFADVKAGKWYTDAVLWAVSAEPQITNGTGAGVFSLNTKLNRATMLTFLYRQQGCPEVDASEPLPYTDVEAGKWYEAAIRWALANGIAEPTSDTVFGVKTLCTRADTVIWLYRLLAE